MRGAERDATPKRTMQKAVEVQTQVISKIAIGLSAAFAVPRNDARVWAVQTRAWVNVRPRLSRNET
jgi:hypothetical protein